MRAPSLDDVQLQLARYRAYASRLARILAHEAAHRDQRWLNAALRAAQEEELGDTPAQDRSE